ncbi:MAG: hypothetical protein ACQEQJ_08955 [Halobacteriota archaeon]
MVSRYEYDLEYDVPGGKREAYEAWLAEATVTWGMDERVTAFFHQVNDTSLDPGERFVFEFDSLRDWAAFVEGAGHRKNVDRLRGLVTGLRATLWHPKRVGTEAVRDAGPVADRWGPHRHRRQSNRP